MSLDLSSRSGMVYPISNYVSYDQFSSKHKVYLVATASHEEPQSYSEVVEKAKWCEAMVYELSLGRQLDFGDHNIT